MQEVVLQNNFIGAWFLENKNVCDDLIEYFETKSVISPGRVGMEGRVDKELKDCQECYIVCNDPVLEDYHTELQKVCDEYIKKYYFVGKTTRWTIIDNIKIQRYCPGEGYYAWHCERESNYGLSGSRNLVFLTYLNDVSDDGETEFFYQGLKVRPQKGLTLIWPADWTHTHRGIASMSQKKYIITGWYNFVE